MVVIHLCWALVCKRDEPLRGGVVLWVGLRMNGGIVVR